MTATSEDATSGQTVSSKLKPAVAAARVTGATTPWGSLSYLEHHTPLSKLSNEKLKRHLSARGEVTEGTKAELVERLSNSISEERERKTTQELELEAKHRRIADLEEQGAVYCAGKNNAGQLGLGDLNDRQCFTVIRNTRGKHVHHVSTSNGANISFATTHQHQVFVWGGAGVGLLGFTSSSKQNVMFETPQLVEELNGEEIIKTSIGSSHACAVSKGGDLFVWGNGSFGVLGTGDTNNVDTPKCLNTLDKIAVVDVVTGEKHACIKTSQHELYAWGHCANGRLGIGNNDEAVFLSSPHPIRMPTSEKVRLIACGAEHTLACTSSTVFSWGSGDGGRLGHGSGCSDRWEPTEIVALKGSHVLDLGAGTWHSACVIAIPLMKDCGWLYTWGSGYQGQLGQGTVCKSSTPALVTGLCDAFVSAVFCGSSHNAAIASDGNLYTWGSNKHGALGRLIEEKSPAFTPHPGIVIEFGTIVNRIGRGLPRSVTCGRDYTIVATHPYDGLTENEALELFDAKRRREEAERQLQEALLRAEEDELRQIQEQETERMKIRYLTSKRLCTMDPKCPGFTYDTQRPSLCRTCGFSVAYHTIVVDEPDTDD